MHIPTTSTVTTPLPKAEGEKKVLKKTDSWMVTGGGSTEFLQGGHSAPLLSLCSLCMTTLCMTKVPLHFVYVIFCVWPLCTTMIFQRVRCLETNQKGTQFMNNWCDVISLNSLWVLDQSAPLNCALAFYRRMKYHQGQDKHYLQDQWNVQLTTSPLFQSKEER